MEASRPLQPLSVSLRSLFQEGVFVGAEDILATDCQVDATRCKAGSTFVVLDADMNDIELAVARGAQAIITERLLPASQPQCLVPDARLAYAQLAQHLAGSPSEDLLMVGVMGTHGKTTISLLIAAMLKRVAGSVGYRTSLGGSDSKQNQIRVSSDDNAQVFAKWQKAVVSKKCPAAVLEISDRMLADQSIGGMEFDVIVIPSLRPSQKMTAMEIRGLESAMLKTCGQLKKHGLVVYNADDARLNQWIQRHEIPAIGYGMDADANIRGNRLLREVGGQGFMVSAGQALMPVNTSFIGDHNARHILGAIATGYAFGLELQEVIGGVERMERIPGRMQRVMAGQSATVIIDLADQADRLAVALHAMQRHDSRPITVVAEVPDVVDAAARAAYGRVLERGASKVILTQSRRPTAAGQAAMWEVLDGCDRPTAIDLVPNRSVAIELALRAISAGDQVLLAGWGANAWTAGESREIKTDLQVAQEILQQLGKESEAVPLSLYRPEGART